jgi:hypothetical protein
MPRAKPDTTVVPAAARVSATLLVMSSASGVAMRLPTTAAALASASLRVPSTKRMAGREATLLRLLG